MSYTQEIVITALCCIGLIRFICWFAPRKIFANVSLVSLRTSTNAVKKFIYTVEGLADLGVVLITWGVIQNDEIMINRGWALVLIPMIILTALAVYAVWKRS